MNWIKNIFNSQKNKIPYQMKKFLIVGLGNIGSEYANTRHNIGFKVLDNFADKENLTFQIENHS